MMIRMNRFSIINISFEFVFRFDWVAPLVDIRRQHLLISLKNNSPLFAGEQTYMGDVCLQKILSKKYFCIYRLKSIYQILIQKNRVSLGMHYKNPIQVQLD